MPTQCFDAKRKLPVAGSAAGDRSRFAAKRCGLRSSAPALALLRFAELRFAEQDAARAQGESADKPAPAPPRDPRARARLLHRHQPEHWKPGGAHRRLRVLGHPVPLPRRAAALVAALGRRLARGGRVHLAAHDGDGLRAADGAHRDARRDARAVARAPRRRRRAARRGEGDAGVDVRRPRPLPPLALPAAGAHHQRSAQNSPCARAHRRRSSPHLTRPCCAQLSALSFAFGHSQMGAVSSGAVSATVGLSLVASIRSTFFTLAKFRLPKEARRRAIRRNSAQFGWAPRPSCARL